MNVYHNNNTGQTIKISYGYEVELPQNTDIVQVVYYEANSVIEIVKQSVYSCKLHECQNAEELVHNLTEKKKQQKRKTNNQSNIEKKKEDCKKPKCKSVANKKYDISYLDNSEINENCIAKDGYVIDANVEIVSEYRTNDSLRRSYNRQRELIFNSCKSDKSIFATFTVDSKPTYEQMNRLTGNFCKWLKRKFDDGLKCGFIFLEPCEDGSWHLHMIIAFNDEISETDNAQIIKWWRKKNKKYCDEQVEIENIETFDRLKKFVDYLNPNSKKKRHRAKYYPVSGQPMRHFGNVSKPNKILTKQENAKEIAGNEMPAMRKKVEILDSENATIFQKSEYFFETNTKLFGRLKLQLSACLNNLDPNEIITRNIDNVKSFSSNKITKGKGSFNDYVYDNYTSRYGQ